MQRYKPNVSFHDDNLNQQLEAAHTMWTRADCNCVGYDMKQTRRMAACADHAAVLGYTAMRSILISSKQMIASVAVVNRKCEIWIMLLIKHF